MIEATLPDRLQLRQVRPYEFIDKSISLQELAYHEAGHAIIRRLINCTFTTIVIKEYEGGIVGSGTLDAVLERNACDEDTTNKPVNLPEDPKFRKALAMRYCCMYLAGLQAELLLQGIEYSGPAIRRDTDHKKARLVLNDAFLFDHLYYPQLLTRYYLYMCWPEVQRTADELLSRHEQSGVGAIHSGDMRDETFFTRDNLPIRWTDEHWD